MDEIVGLQQHVAEFGVADAAFALQAAFDRIFGEHHVDGEMLADVAQEFQVAERAHPVEVVHEHGGVRRRRRNPGSGASGQPCRRRCAGARRERADCALRFCRWGRRSCRSPRRRARLAYARRVGSGGASRAARGCRRAGCRRWGRSRRRACAASLSQVVICGAVASVVWWIRPRQESSSIMSLHCVLAISTCRPMDFQVRKALA